MCCRFRYRPDSASQRLLALFTVLTALVLAGCDRGSGQSSNPPSSTFPTVPSVLVNSTIQNPGGIAAGYGKLTLVALDPSDGAVRWRYQSDWHPYHSVGAPVEADGIVYTFEDPVPSMAMCSEPAGNLVALRESDGHEIWSVSVGFLPTRPVVANGVVYTSALHLDECATPHPQHEGKSYYALRASDGHQLWRADLTQDTSDANPDHSIGIDSSLQLIDGTLVATAEANVAETGDRTGHFFAFDTTSGKLRWKNTFFSNQSLYSIAANGLIYVRTHQAEAPTDDWTAYRASDGQQVLKVSGGYSGQFLVVGGMIYADATYEAATSTPQQRVFDTRVVALDAHSGQQLWQVSDTGEVNGNAYLVAVRDNTAYVQTGPSTFTEKRASHWTLEGVDGQTGHIRWTATLRWQLGRVVMADSALYGYSNDLLPGQLMALGLGDGHSIWSTPMGSAQNGGELGHLRGLVLGTGVLYAVNESGMVVAVRAQDGAIRWKTQIEGDEIEMTMVS
jgi:outer membrane protein assembly factor BamB